VLKNVSARQSVFIVQLEGTKAWNLYAPKYQLALKKQIRGKAGDVVRRDEMGDLLMQVRDPSALVSRLWSELVNGKFGANLRRRWLTAHCVTARNMSTKPTPDFFVPSCHCIFVDCAASG
jgi:hypothetical protein